MSEPVHWQDAKVTDRLTQMIFSECEGWLETKGILSASGKLEKHILGAILHGGEALDGYVMATFLETRYWPADQDLVAHLAKALRFRGEILVEFNAPEIPSFSYQQIKEWQRFPIAMRFTASMNGNPEQFIIIEVDSDGSNHNYVIQLVPNGKTFNNIPHGNIIAAGSDFILPKDFIPTPEYTGQEN